MSRFYTLFAVLVILLSISMSLDVQEIAAQGVDPCFGLVVDACTIIGEASANTFSNLSTFNFDFQLAFSLSGLEAVGLGQDTALNVNGTGRFIRSDSDSLTAVPASIQLDFTAQLINQGQALDAVLSTRLIDDQVYLQLNDGDWRGIALDTLLESTLLSSVLSQSVTSFPGQPSQFDMTGLMSGATDLLQTPGFIVYQRLEDEVNNVDVPRRFPFSFSLDFAPLFASEAFQQQLDQALRLMGQFDSSLENIGMLAPVLLQNSRLNINLTQSVNSELNMIDQLALSIDGSLDLNPVLGTTETNPTEPIRLIFELIVSVSDANTAMTITTPDRYVIITLEELGLE